MSEPRDVAGALGAFAGYERSLLASLPPGAQRALAAIGLLTPIASVVVGCGGRQWLLDAAASTPVALVGGVVAALLALATMRLLVAGGGMPARAMAEHRFAAAAPGAPSPPRYRPAWLAPLWQLWIAALWTLPLAAHATVAWAQRGVDSAAMAAPTGVAGWLQAAWQTPTAAAVWMGVFAALGAAPALLALLLVGARRRHAEARAARDCALVEAAHRRHRAQVDAALRVSAGTHYAGLAAEAFDDPPFDRRRRAQPWQEALPTEVSHLRWLLRRQSQGHRDDEAQTEPS